ncbi:MAG: hypothetical protein ACI4MJ_03435 [Aristaeellaceae bacterium]
MKTLLKWFGRTLLSALTLVLVIILLPYASRWMNSVLPDLSSSATTASLTLAQHLQTSARLETSIIEEQGILESTTDALFLGPVQKVTVRYTYRASLGIDLSKVEMQLNGNRIILLLPDMEILSDSLTAEDVQKNDFWYPLTEERLRNLLADEQARCQAYYLQQQTQNPEYWSQIITVLEGTISQWISLSGSSVTIEYVPASQADNL